MAAYGSGESLNVERQPAAHGATQMVATPPHLTLRGDIDFGGFCVGCVAKA